MKRALVIIGIVVVVAAVVVGGWFLFWTVAQANANNQYEVNIHSQTYQSALIQQERDRATGYVNATNAAQKAQIAATFCASYAELTQPTPDLTQAFASMCH